MSREEAAIPDQGRVDWPQEAYLRSLEQLALLRRFQGEPAQFWRAFLGILSSMAEDRVGSNHGSRPGSADPRGASLRKTIRTRMGAARRLIFRRSWMRWQNSAHAKGPPSGKATVSASSRCGSKPASGRGCVSRC